MGNFRGRQAFLIVPLLLGAGGCREATPAMLPVTGKVLYRGAALQSGTIVFTPDATRGQRGPIALGKIGADGSYSLQTGDQYGASAGWYRVTVAALVTGGSPEPGLPYHIPRSLLPEKYRDPELSRLSCEVKPNQINSIDFELD